MLSENQKDIIKAFADCNMKIAETARKMFFCRSTIEYQLERVKDKTGLDPCKFHDLNKLLSIIERGANENE